jgi:beta-glucosidase
VGATDISERTLREVYLAPWRAMVQRAGLRALMPSHQLVNDVPVHGNAWTGQTLLRGELNFSLGLSVSDCSDIGVLIDWGLAPNSTVAAALGLEAGVDMDNMCGRNNDGTWTYEHIEAAVASGFVSEKRVNESCSRVLAQKFAAGLFEDPNAGVVSDGKVLNALLDSPAHRRVALEAAEQGCVLLQNKDRMLPLTPRSYNVGKGVALIGESSSCEFSSGEGLPREPRVGQPSDPYHCKAQLNMLGKTQHHVGNLSVVTVGVAIELTDSPLLRLKGSAIGANIDSVTDEKQKAAAVALAARSGLAILVLGDSEHSCAEWGDTSSLALPNDQPELLRRVLETGVPTVLLLIHGRPASFEIERSSNAGNFSSLLEFPNMRAVVAAWRPGEEGGNALVNLLLGKMISGAGGPSGRLAQAWPRTEGQIGGPSTPWFQHRNGKWISNKKGLPDPLDGLYHYDPYVNAPSTPAFAFGFGLSFGSSFEYSHARAAVLPSARAVTVDVTLRNTGTSDGAEVVQVYATAPLDNIVRYWKRFVGFRKVLVSAGEELSVTVEIDTDDLAVYVTPSPGSPTAGTRAVLSGVYTLSVGGSSTTDLTTTSFSL